MISLLKVTEVYRVDSEDEALSMREDASECPDYELNSFSYTAKIDKKAEEEYFVVKMTKVVNQEKNPISRVMVNYDYAR